MLLALLTAVSTTLSTSVLTTPAGSPQTYSCAALRRGVSVSAAPGLTVTLKRVGERALRLTATPTRMAGAPTQPTKPNSPTKTVPLECWREETEVRVADYNFDGVLDFAVPGSVGYGGVNVFGRVFFREARTGTFRGSSEVELGNSTPDPLRRVLEGGVKSGPTYSVITHCLTPDRLNFYPCRELSPTGNSPDADAYSARWLSPEGRTLAERPFVGRGGRAEEWTVTVTRAFFHARPEARTRQTRYVVRGDRVEVIELRGEWAWAAYTAKTGRVTVGWLLKAGLR